MKELKSAHYSKVKKLVEVSEVNTLFAKSVVYHHVDGTILVDNLEMPDVAYIKHPYGMSLLVGKSDNTGFNVALKRYFMNLEEVRHSPEWLQIYPLDWTGQLDNILGLLLFKMQKGHGYQDQSEAYPGAKVFQYERLNFAFDPKCFHKKQRQTKNDSFRIDTFNEDDFNTFGRLVTPRYFWNSSSEFLSRSIGYSLSIDHKPIAVAFASFIIGDQLEIGVETIEEYRGRGYATVICSILIDYCLEHGYTPVWSCHSGNLGSKKLAIQLGFKPTLTLPYYHLV